MTIEPNNIDWVSHYTHFETELVVEGEPQTLIVIPNQAEYVEMANQLANDVKSKTGVPLPIKWDAEVDEEVRKRYNLIVLGNLATNKLIEKLYVEFYTFVDRWYPSAGGYVVSTIHQPWGHPRNVILLGGSDLEGVKAALHQFCSRLRAGNPLVVERLMDIKIGPALLTLKAQRKTDFWPQMPWNQQVSHQWLAGAQSVDLDQAREDEISRVGLNYLFTGDDEWAAQFRDMMLEHGTKHHHLFFLLKVMAWDLIEESPALSNEDRVKIIQILLEVLRSNEGAANGGFRSQIGKENPRQNHQTRVAQALFFGGRYFYKYFHLEEAKQWTEDVKRFYAPQVKCSKPMCDDSSDQWQWTLENIATWALASGDLEFFESGVARRAADRAIICCNNMGEMPSMGDCWEVSFPASILSKAAYYYKDGRYQYLINKRDSFLFPLMTDDTNRAFDAGIQPVVPEDMIGIKAAPIDELYYHFIGGAKPPVPREQTFDKLSFRNGFEEKEQYLLLDGIAGGSHAYDDANSIVEVSQNGRLFVVTVDNLIGPKMSEHNAVTVAKNGKGARPPTFARLETLADLGEVGYTRTVLENYCSADWARNIWWWKGKYFVVIDELIPKEDGHYAFQCYWRTLGEPEFSKHALKLTQRDREGIEKGTESFFLKSAGDTSNALKRDRNPGGKEPLMVYRYAEPVLNIFSMAITGEMAAGERRGFMNLLYASSDKADVSYEIRKVAPLVAVVKGEDGAAYWGICKSADKEFKIGDWTLKAAAFLVGEHSFALINGTSFSGKAPLFSASRPLSIKYDLSAGRIVCVADKEAQLELLVGFGSAISEKGNSTVVVKRKKVERNELVSFTVPSGRSELTLSIPPSDVSFSIHLPEVTQPAPQVEVHKELTLKELWKVQTEGAINSIHCSDLDADGKKEMACGSDDGSVYLIDDTGALRWTYQTQGSLNSVYIADLDFDGQGNVIAGSDDCHIYVLNHKGAIEWMAEPDFGHPYHPYWTLKKSMVKRVFADDIDKDGKQEVLAGVGNMCLHLYDYKGNQRWRLETPYGTFLTFDVLDFDSDGEREIVGGTDYLSCTSVCRVISREGRFKKSFSNDGWTSGLTAMVFADLNGDGRLEMVNGTSVGNLRVFDVETGNVLWQVNLGDEVRGALVTDLNSDGRLKLVTASASTYVCAFQPDGEKVWFRSVGNAIACLSLAEIEGTKYLVVGCEDGQLYLLNPNGSVVCAFGIGSKINELSVQRMKGSEPTQIIVGSEDGILRAIAPAP